MSRTRYPPRMSSDAQDRIDARIQTYYTSGFDESVRLTTRSAQGPLEFQRTQEIIRAAAPQGRVLDVGGGAGIHARALQDAGYDVALVDPVERHVLTAQAAGVRARQGDARELDSPDGAYDVVLLLGPLYHLAEVADRRAALVEARRVLRPGGLLFASALSRYVAFGAASLARSVPDAMPAAWADLIVDGIPVPGLRFPAGHFHTAEELEEEVRNAGFAVRDVVGVEGPAGLLLETREVDDPEVLDAALRVARAAGATPGIRDQSAHLLAIGAVGA